MSCRLGLSLVSYSQLTLESSHGHSACTRDGWIRRGMGTCLQCGASGIVQTTPHLPDLQALPVCELGPQAGTLHTGGTPMSISCTGGSQAHTSCPAQQISPGHCWVVLTSFAAVAWPDGFRVEDIDPLPTEDAEATTPGAQGAAKRPIHKITSANMRTCAGDALKRWWQPAAVSAI